VERENIRLFKVSLITRGTAKGVVVGLVSILTMARIGAIAARKELESKRHCKNALNRFWAIPAVAVITLFCVVIFGVRMLQGQPSAHAVNGP